MKVINLVLNYFNLHLVRIETNPPKYKVIRINELIEGKNLDQFWGTNVIKYC